MIYTELSNYFMASFFRNLQILGFTNNKPVNTLSVRTSFSIIYFPAIGGPQ